MLVSKQLDGLGRTLLVIVDAHDRLQESGVALRSGREPTDTSTPSGRLVFQILAPFAEYDRKSIRERTKGLARKLAVLLHRPWSSGEVYDPLYNARHAGECVA